MTTCAITFVSVHDVLKAEGRLKELGWKIRVIPVPKQISPDCGMALQIACDRVDEVKRALRDMAPRLKGVYRVEGAAFFPLEETA